MFEWQKHSQDSTDEPPYTELLEFLNMRAQTAEVSDSGKRTTKNEPKKQYGGKQVVSFTTSTSTSAANCVLCKSDRHPFYVCPKFKNLNHQQMVGNNYV